MLVQFIIALFVLRTKAGYDIFAFISTLCTLLLGFANEGVTFLTADTVPDLHWFLTGVVPPIIFFVSFVQLLYHWYVSKRTLSHYMTRRLTMIKGTYSVVHRQVRRLLLLGTPCFRCRGRRSCSLSIYRTGRICHVD